MRPESWAFVYSDLASMWNMCQGRGWKAEGARNLLHASWHGQGHSCLSGERFHLDIPRFDLSERFLRWTMTSWELPFPDWEERSSFQLCRLCGVTVRWGNPTNTLLSFFLTLYMIGHTDLREQPSLWQRTVTLLRLLKTSNMKIYCDLKWTPILSWLFQYCACGLSLG